MQNIKIISQPKHDLWANEISRDLGLGFVSDRYPILHMAPGLVTYISMVFYTDM